MKLKRILFCLLLILACCVLVACGQEQEVVQAYQPEATPVPTPSPTPYMEPIFDVGTTIYVNGTSVASVTENDVDYVALEAALKANFIRMVTYPEKSITNIPEQFAFTVGETEYLFYPGESYYTVAGDDEIRYEFEGSTIVYNNQKSLYVPVAVFCQLNGLLIIKDEANTAIYCTEPVDWTVASGYKVPIIEFYSVGMANNYELLSTDYFVRDIDFPDYLDAIYESGYEPIWFSDLEHVEDYTNPVILSFCYNGSGLYSAAFPVIKSYQAKFTVFVYPDQMGKNGYVNANQLKEMVKSGYVELQSGGITVETTGTVSERRQAINMAESYLTVLRLTGNLPLAFAYAEGISDEASVAQVPDYFKFGVVHEDNECFVTGGNMTEIPAARFIRINGAYNVISKLDGFTGKNSHYEQPAQTYQEYYYYE